MQCACYIAESLDGNPLRLNPCPEHERWAKAIRDYEREACARLASGMGDAADCDDRGMQDPETGEVPCSAERRGEVCVCVERSDLAHKIATKIRARSA